MFGITIMLAAGIVWGGVTPENHLGGRPASPGYLQGKVFLVDCRDYSKNKADLERLEDFWLSYKSKPFVMLGSHCGGDVEAAKENIKSADISFSVYAGATFESQTFEAQNGLIYVIHQGGKMAIKTKDLNRAFEAVISALTWGAVPSTVGQYRKLIDYELEVLPGKAYLHIKDMQKALPSDAQYYAAAFKKLDADEEVKKVSKLEEIARRVKDFDPNTKKGGKTVKVSKKKIEALIEAAAPLKESENPLIVQEAKNCIADLKWAMAEM